VDVNGAGAEQLDEGRDGRRYGEEDEEQERSEDQLHQQSDAATGPRAATRKRSQLATVSAAMK